MLKKPLTRRIGSFSNAEADIFQGRPSPLFYSNSNSNSNSNQRFGMTTDSLPNLICTACGAGFYCAMASQVGNLPAAPCWCFALPHDWAVPRIAQDDTAPRALCLCPTCLQRPRETTAALAA